MKNMPVKLVITSKSNLQFKYGKKFTAVGQLLEKVMKADAKKNLEKKIVYVDDAASPAKPVSAL